jgi:hypothetical protein
VRRRRYGPRDHHRADLNSPFDVARVWRDHKVKPWRTDTFKSSDDKRFEEKLLDVVGLHLNPLERGVVLPGPTTARIVSSVGDELTRSDLARERV